MTALVSICIPNFNYGNFVESAIRSSLAQTYRFVEVVVVDNCSTDNSHSVITDLLKSLEFQYYRNHGNLGMVKNFIKCRSLCQGEYVVFLSSDDILKPNFISRAVSVFDTNDSLSMVAAHCDFIDDDGEISLQPPFFEESGIISSDEHSRILLMSGIYFPSQVLIKTSLFDRVGGWSERFPIFFDWDLWFRLSLEGSIGYLNEGLVLYRHHGENASSKAVENMQMVFEKYLLKLRFFEFLDSDSILHSYKSDSISKIAGNSLYYAAIMLRNGNFQLGIKYLEISKVFDPLIVENDYFKALTFCASVDKAKSIVLLNKISEHLDDFSTKRPFKLPANSSLLL
jgi:GT2 family glycosyltransferase